MDFCKIMEQQSILTKKEFYYFFTKIKDGPSVYAWSQVLRVAVYAPAQAFRRN